MGFIDSVLGKVGYSRNPTAGVTHAQVLLAYYAAHVLQDIAETGHASAWTINHIEKFFRLAEKKNVIDSMLNPSGYFKNEREMLNKLSGFINNYDPPVGWLFWSEEPFPTSEDEAVQASGKYLQNIYRVYKHGGSLDDFSILKFLQYYNEGFDYEGSVSPSDLKYYIRLYKNPNYGGGKIDAFTPVCMSYIEKYFSNFYGKI